MISIFFLYSIQCSLGPLSAEEVGHSTELSTGIQQLDVCGVFGASLVHHVITNI